MPAKSGNSATTIVVVILVVAVVGLFGCGGFLLALLLPAVQSTREAARRLQCQNNVKQIALALHTYHETYGTFPPAYTVDEEGNRLHSWRTLILPFLDHGALYDRVDLSKPWDAPENQLVADTPLPVFCCPSDGSMNSPSTNYMALVGPGGVFEGEHPVGIDDITDGMSNSILVVEVTAAPATSWMAPVDLDVAQMQMAINGGNTEIRSRHPGGAQAAMTDGSAHFLSETVSGQVLRALSTRNGGETVPLDF